MVLTFYAWEYIHHICIKSNSEFNEKESQQILIFKLREMGMKFIDVK